MLNRYSFYLISEEFKIFESEKHLGVIMNMIEKGRNSVFFLEQFKLIMAKLDVFKIIQQLKLRFKERKDFAFEEDSVMIYNDIAETYEKMLITDNSISLEYTSSKSILYDFLALYYPDLIAVNEIFQEILPLHSIKSLKIS